ncbi:MAG TPA: methyl-accepting chemotaxis protein [Firmicutes bacterium]|nr:methyl-accepting chemotaxis protein [Bacillota bacterium]
MRGRPGATTWPPSQVISQGGRGTLSGWNRVIGILRVGVVTAIVAAFGYWAALELGKVASDAAVVRRVLYLGGGLIFLCFVFLAFSFGRDYARACHRTAEVLRRCAEGDLDATSELASVAGLDEVASAAQQVIMRFRELVEGISRSTEKLKSNGEALAHSAGQASQAASEIARAIEDVAQGATDQARNVTETGKLMDQLKETIDQIAAAAQEQSKSTHETSLTIKEMTQLIEDVTAHAARVARAAEEAFNAARLGRDTVGQTMQGMERIRTTVLDTAGRVKQLGQHSEEIGNILEVISDIADQTNLLALNAAIEAARAGDHGRGFAVVADEVRKLAQRSSNATKEIASIVGNIRKGTETVIAAMDSGTEEVAKGSALSNEAGKALESIVQAMQVTNKEIEGITEVAKRLAANSQKVVSAVSSVEDIAEGNAEFAQAMATRSVSVQDAVRNVSAISEETASGAEEIAASAQEVSASMEQVADAAAAIGNIAKDLEGILEKFRFGSA